LDNDIDHIQVTAADPTQNDEPQERNTDVTPDEAAEALNLLKRFALARCNISERLIDCTIEFDSLIRTAIQRIRPQKQLKMFDFFGK
jgi:hypothetical protein